MALIRNYRIILVSVLVVVLTQNCLLAQNRLGYNYGPSTEVTNTANIQSKSTNQALRPKAVPFPTGSTSVGIVPSFPIVATGFAATPNVFNTAYGAGQRTTGTGQGAGTVYASTAAASSLPSSTNTLAQRNSDVGIYRASSSSVGPTRGPSVPISFDQDYDGDFSAIPGQPGVNYPVYSQVPQTNFDCAQQPLPGYYSDVESQCQVFHICALNRTYSFLCPNGTIFSQETLVCVWWNQFDCPSAPQLYPNNAFIYDYGNNRAAAENTAYSGAANRQQGNYQISSTSRTPTSSIYGIANTRNTVVPTSFASPVQPAAFLPSGSNVPSTSGRFAPTGGAMAATFQTATPAPTSALAFGAVLRGAGAESGVQTDARFGGLQEVTYTNANVPIASSSTNREYLPPGRP